MRTARFPPGPKGQFLAGNLPEFRRDRLGFLTRCAREFGDVVSVRFGPHRIFVLSDLQAIEHVLVTGSRNFRKHFALRNTPLVLGKGLLTSDGDFWLRQRRLIQPAFLRQRIAGYAEVMVDYTTRMLASWQPGQQRDILAEMMSLTLQIAAKTLFDAEAGGHAGDVVAALRVSQESFLRRSSSLVPPPLWIPTPNNLRFKRAVRRLNEIIYGFIAQRRASGEQKPDVMSLLLNARDEEDQSGMTDLQLRDEAMTLFLAGHETTALSLSWTWYLLATHPEVEQRLLDEVQQVLAGRLPTADDVPRLPFTEKVVMESMRLYPPAYVIGREAIHECEVAGFGVPVGMTLLMSQWVMHRHPRWWDRPDQFDPDRWTAQLQQTLPKFAYFPFGGGPRLCIGNTFAMMETVLVLATIAQQFRFTVLPGHVSVPAPTFTLRPQGGTPTVLERR